MVEVFPGLRTVRIADADGLDTEVYILECKEGLILVDVGFTPDCHENIQSELASMRKSWSDIKKIIITHAHGDHINNLSQVKELTRSEILIGVGDELALEERTGIKADVTVDTGNIIDVCGGIEVIRIPGHSDGNLCLLLHKHNALIAGDTIFGDEEGTMGAPPEKYCNDVNAAAKNLIMLAGYDFDSLLLSHGKNILLGAKEKVLELIACTRADPMNRAKE
jgi:glyoxylase-like metal-dependent hydrolase (beta-lactamase superfamily II)